MTATEPPPQPDAAPRETMSSISPSGVIVDREATWCTYRTEDQLDREKAYQADGTGDYLLMYEATLEVRQPDEHARKLARDVQWVDEINGDKYRAAGGREFFVLNLTLWGGPVMAWPLGEISVPRWFRSVRMYMVQQRLIDSPSVPYDTGIPGHLPMNVPDRDTPRVLWQLILDLIESGAAPLEALLSEGIDRDDRAESLRLMLGGSYQNRDRVVLAPYGRVLYAVPVERNAYPGGAHKLSLAIDSGRVIWGPPTDPPPTSAVPLYALVEDPDEYRQRTWEWAAQSPPTRAPEPT